MIPTVKPGGQTGGSVVRALVAPSEDSGLIPRIHMVAITIYNSNAQDPAFVFFYLCTEYTRYIDMHVGKTPVHIKRKKKINRKECHEGKADGRRHCW